MKDIVITVGTAKGSALALIRGIREFVDCGVYVICTDNITSRIIKDSKFVNEVFLINTKNYLEEFKNWRLKKDFKHKPILYFTNDTSCYLIDQERVWFESYFELCLPSSEIVRSFTQKGIAEFKAQQAGLIVPKTQIIETEMEIDFVYDNFSFPVILKPRATYLKKSVNFKTKLINEKESFKPFALEIVQENNTLICQEYIPGDDDTAYYYLFYRNADGLIHENMGKKILQSPPGRGIMAKGLVEYSEELAKTCQKFLKTINYVGIGGIEFKKYNGKFYFIEMSVRLEGFFKIAEISNSYISLASYSYLANPNTRICLHNERSEDGMVYMDLLATFKTQFKSRKFRLLINDFFLSLFNKRVKLNVYHKNDAKPFWKYLKYFY